MPSFDPQIPVSSVSHNPFCISDFGAFEQSIGFRLEDAVNPSVSTVVNSTKPSGQAVPSDPLPIITFEKSSSSLEINPSTPAAESQRSPQQKGQQSSLLSISCRNLDNWEESAMAEGSPRTDISTDGETDERNQMFDRDQSHAIMASDSSDRSKDKSDQKTLRRLAQNREAARKSRLRKKAYVQQLESSRLKLTQLEQELQRARQQGIFISSSGDQAHSMAGNGAMAFDVEYARWLEEQNRQMNELRTAVNAHASMWQTPAERCFLWLGGFRSSELLKLLMNQLEPLTEQQLAGIGNLQQSSQQAEDALSQGMEALQQSLADTLSTANPSGNGNVANYMGQMAMAMGKLGTLEGFIRQADNLREQTLQQMHRILTTRQSARALLAIHDYFSRLRALSSLWLARPKE